MQDHCYLALGYGFANTALGADDEVVAFVTRQCQHFGDRIFSKDDC